MIQDLFDSIHSGPGPTGPRDETGIPAPTVIVLVQSCTDSVAVSRAEDRPVAGFWSIGLRESLPVIPIRLRPARSPGGVTPGL
jgi:hypothetical protein